MVSISKKNEKIVFALLMSFSTALVVSGFITFIHGVQKNSFTEVWLLSFLVAWPIVFLSILIVAPQIYKLLNIIVKK